MLPDLSNLCIKCNAVNHVEPTGVTREQFNPLLPGMSLKPGFTEIDVLDAKDLECSICSYFINGPAEGFSLEAGDKQEMVDEQTAFNVLSGSETKDARPAYYRIAMEAAASIRLSNPRRTQIEWLNPGCLHQFHRICLSRWCNSSPSFEKRTKCPICSSEIDASIFASLTGQGSSGTVRPREDESNSTAYESYIATIDDNIMAFHRFMDPTSTNVRNETYYSYMSTNSEMHNLFSIVYESFIRTYRNYRLIGQFPDPGSGEFIAWEIEIGKIYFLYRYMIRYLPDYDDMAVELLIFLQRLVDDLDPQNWSLIRSARVDGRSTMNSGWTIFNMRDGIDEVLSREMDMRALNLRRHIVLEKLQPVVPLPDESASLTGRINRLSTQMFMHYARGLLTVDTEFDIYTWLTLLVQANVEIQYNNNNLYLEALSYLRTFFFSAIFSESSISQISAYMRSAFQTLTALTDELLETVTVPA